MAIPRASTAYRSLGRAVFRRVGTQPRTQAWRQAGRRQYASGPVKKSSDLPWMIGSAAFTIPAAVWLLGQAPQKSDHHGEHAHKEEAESKEEPAEEESEGKEEEAPADEDKGGEEKESDKSEGDSDEKKEDSDKSEGESDEKKKDSDKKDDKPKDEGKDDKSKDEDKDDKSDDSSSDGGDDKGTPDTSDNEDDGKLDGYEKPSSDAPGQINYRPGLGKGPGEGQKGSGKRTEKKGEKDSAGDKSGAQNPYLDDDEKSKKGEGMKETAKIHGTVDTSRPAR